MPEPSLEEDVLPNELNLILNSLGLPVKDETSFDMEKWCRDNELSQYLGRYTTAEILRIHSSRGLKSNAVNPFQDVVQECTAVAPSTKKVFEKANILNIEDSEESFRPDNKVSVEEIQKSSSSITPELREDSIFHLLRKIDSECESLKKRKILSVNEEDFESAQLLKLGWQSLMELRKEVESRKTIMDEFLKDEKYMKCKELKEEITNLEGEVSDILRQLASAKLPSLVRNDDVDPAPVEQTTPVT